MLINIRVSELISDTNNNIPLAILAILAFFIPISNVLPNNTTTIAKSDIQLNDLYENVTNTGKTFYVSSNN